MPGCGYAHTVDRTVRRGGIEERSFSAFFLKRRTLRQVVTLDWKRDARRALPLIRSVASVDSAAADPEIDLRRLAPKVAEVMVTCRRQVYME